MKALKSKTNLFAIATTAYLIFSGLNAANKWVVIPDEVNQTILAVLGGGTVMSVRHAIQKAEDKPKQ